MIYFTSDTHFGHKNILEYCARPFETIEEHDEGIVQRWNEIVKPGDTVYHLGDFSFRSSPVDIVPRLNGEVHLVLGNHDKPIRKKRKLQEAFVSVTDYKEIKVPDEEMDLKQTIVLCHYPIESWNKRHHGSWHLHGHCHGTLPSDDHQARVDVGVDVWGYRPVSYEEVKAHMTTKAFKPIDHHSRGLEGSPGRYRDRARKPARDGDVT